jgi:hypothetical protein
MVARSSAQSGYLAELGRRGLEALSTGLSPVASDSPFARTRREDPDWAHTELVRVVLFAAYRLLAEARGLLPSIDPESFAHDARERLALRFEFDAQLASKLWRSLGELDGEPVDYTTLDIEELGCLYEGMLGRRLTLAEKPSLVLSPPRKAGSEPGSVVVDVARLLALDPEKRAPFLRSHGVPVAKRLARRLSEAVTPHDVASALAAERNAPGLAYAEKDSLFLRVTGERRRTGSHYTPRGVAAEVVKKTLLPLIPDGATPEAILQLRVCDPACGSGAFLLAACEFLATRLLVAEGNATPDRALVFAARRRVIEHCLFGVDENPRAIELARFSLALAAGDVDPSRRALESSLCVGDAVVSDARKGARVANAALDWTSAFPEVFAQGGGFDAFVGNPPWVSYVGRAAQPLPEARRKYYLAEYASFSGYRNLQGIFVERCASFLKPSGRLGLVLPSSMAELDGYRPTRSAHDRLCETDQELSELPATAFEGVFQPAMVLVSTRSDKARSVPPGGPWPLERPDLDALARQLLHKLDLPTLPASLFGERGLQTTGDDSLHLGESCDERHRVPLRSGADIAPFRRHPPSHYADPSWFEGRLRASAEWQRVRVLIRQTARAPLAALSDGEGFRNSILAGFEDRDYPAEFVVAYLNSSPIRWLHFMRHRDARHGMPQLKIGHLRATPAPPRTGLVEHLAELGQMFSQRNVGIERHEQAALDGLVCDAFELEAKERERIFDWAARFGTTRA